MDDKLLEIGIDEVMRRVKHETEMIEKIESELEALHRALPIHLQLKQEYQAILDKHVGEWQMMQKRKMDREKLLRKKGSDHA